MELMSFVRQTMFDSVMRLLFGFKNVPQTEAGMRELEQKFVKFEEDFEYGTQIPEFLIRCEPYPPQYSLLFQIILLTQGMEQQQILAAISVQDNSDWS